MDKGEILALLLEGSDRWNCNDQPEADYVASVLAGLPVEDVIADDDELRVSFTAPLTAQQAFDLALAMSGDESSLDDIGEVAEFWWD